MANKTSESAQARRKKAVPEPAPAPQGGLDRFFGLAEAGSSVPTELRAGLATLLTMAYIMFVNPAILEKAGMDHGAVFVATCLAAAAGSAIMGLYANYPIALAPGMGLNAYFAFTVVPELGGNWQLALALVFISSVLFFALSLSQLRAWLIDAIPLPLKLGIAAGISFFLALIGLQNAGIVTDHPVTLVTLGDLSKPQALLAAAGFVLVPPGSVPKTSSGKIRRAAAKELYATGALVRPQRGVRQQMVRLALASLGPQLSRLSQTIKDRLYAAWWWTVMSVGFAVGWPAVMVLPRLQWRWAVLRGLSRAALAAMGVPISVSGLARVPRGQVIIMFNHASYADAIILAAVLPGEPTFLAKKELAQQFFAGNVLRRLGALFLERYDLSGSLADTAAATDAAKTGRLLVFFPEGTFTRRPVY